MDENIATCPYSYSASSNGDVMYCVDGIPFWNYEFGMKMEDYNINRAFDVCRAWDPITKTCKLIPGHFVLNVVSNDEKI